MFAEDSSWNVAPEPGSLCESCSEEPATVQMVRVEGQSITHTRLCRQCAEEMAGQVDGISMMFAVPANLGAAFASLLERVTTGNPPALEENVTCGQCGTSLHELLDSGLLGCAACYRVFARHLEEAVVARGETREHPGKVPSRRPDGDQQSREIVRLQRMLRELVASERFEEAASVRDRLAELGEGRTRG